LKSDERIFISNRIVIEDADKNVVDNKLIGGLKEVSKTKPKYGIGKWRLRFYQFLGGSKNTKGVKKWLQDLLGTSPDLYSKTESDFIQSRMEAYLQDHGYFDALVSSDSIVDKYYVSVIYNIQPNEQYCIDSVYLLTEESPLSDLVEVAINETSLKIDSPYSKDILINERKRLVEHAANNGFIDVSDNNFIFYLDTLHNRSSLDIVLKLNTESDSTVDHPYYLNDTWVYQDYSLNEGDEKGKKDSINYQGINIIQNKTFLEPGILNKSIDQERGDLYSKKFTDKTLSKLLDLGVYKFVNLRYTKTSDTTRNLVDRHIFLTPSGTRDISAEIRANTRTGNFFGSGLILRYTDRNLLGSAEYFEIGLSGAIETQFGDDGSLINSAEAGLQLGIALPYTWPFDLSNENFFSSKTLSNFGINYEKRTEFYTLNSLTLKFGYDWVVNSGKSHQFFPIRFNRIKVLEKSDDLEEALLENPSLKSSFEDVYIIGIQYIFTLGKKIRNSSVSQYLFKANVESSGNLSYLVQSTLKGKKDTPYEVLGLPFAQFVKTDLDFRYYLPSGPNSLAFRLFGGVGYSYGNSSVLPYVKQYFSGGSNGIRAFPIRTLGPGSYINPEYDSAENEFIDQTGDIKLEANIEYRFPIAGYLKGAFFMDAGNIWLLDDSDDQREGAEFRFNEFISEIAIGAGVGFRFDINAFVIRMDIAYPIRKPFLPQGERWVLDEIDFFNSDWRDENLVFNLALGYPF
jgi:outer membrane protein assembly factor BamA